MTARAGAPAAGVAFSRTFPVWGKLNVGCFPGLLAATRAGCAPFSAQPAASHRTTFEAHQAKIETVLSDNGREFCGRPDQHPYELFLQLEEIDHRTTRSSVRNPTASSSASVHREGRAGTALDHVGKRTFGIALRHLTGKAVPHVRLDLGWAGVFKVATVPKSDELRRVLRACRGYFVTAAIFSLAINLLYLAAPLYMLQVYDRVISSASQITLLMLTIALLVAFIALAGLDMVRARVLTRASVRLDRLMAGRVISAVIDRAAAVGGARSQMLRDFDTFSQFVTGPGIHAIFDLPWAPIEADRAASKQGRDARMRRRVVRTGGGGAGPGASRLCALA